MTQDKNKDAGLEQAIFELRNDTPSAPDVERAGARVWATIASAGPERNESARIEGCATVRNLLAGYAAGDLSDARMLLVRDHLHECVECRNLAQAKAETTAV